MPSNEASRLRRVAAEVDAEVERVTRTVAEITNARSAIESRGHERLVLYGAAALLETFYSGVERALVRIATALSEVPQGPSWHRTLLEDAALDVPKVRPAVLTGPTLRLLEPYLGFRHRFRNLYLFDLDEGLLTPLLDGAPGAWSAAEADLRGFSEALRAMADALELP